MIYIKEKYGWCWMMSTSTTKKLHYFDITSLNELVFIFVFSFSLAAMGFHTYQFDRLRQILCHKTPPVASRAARQLFSYARRGEEDPLRPRGGDLCHRGAAERDISEKREKNWDIVQSIQISLMWSQYLQKVDITVSLSQLRVSLLNVLHLVLQSLQGGLNLSSCLLLATSDQLPQWHVMSLEGVNYAHQDALTVILGFSRLLLLYTPVYEIRGVLCIQSTHSMKTFWSHVLLTSICSRVSFHFFSCSCRICMDFICMFFSSSFSVCWIEIHITCQ